MRFREVHHTKLLITSNELSLVKHHNMMVKISRCTVRCRYIAVDFLQKPPPPPHPENNTLYGTPFCRFKYCLSCVSVTAVIYAIWRYIGQRYNGTRQYCTLRAMKWSREKYIPRIQPAVIRIHDIRYLHRVIPGNICAAFIDYLLYYSDHLINVAVRSVASTHLIYEYALKPGYKMPYTAHHACAYIYLSFCMFDTILSLIFMFYNPGPRGFSMQLRNELMLAHNLPANTTSVN